MDKCIESFLDNVFSKKADENSFIVLPQSIQKILTKAKFKDSVKNSGSEYRMRSNGSPFSYIADLVEFSDNINALTSTDIKTIHDEFWNKDVAIDFYMVTDSKDKKFIEEKQPIPIFGYGTGDFICALRDGTFVDYIHDDSTSFINQTTWSSLADVLKYLRQNEILD